ncbi:MAG: metallophosphoesterase [Deltaproteobacteria bacterium]|nr:MAG: metallophosphoesterase [Deltaproteobacteria bacterium]
MWFPLPASPTHIFSLSPSGHGLPVEHVYQLLHDTTAHEWRERVGVLNPRDGSGKNSTRLLLTRNFVFKTDKYLCTPSERGARKFVADRLEAIDNWGIWHPQKQWLLFQVEDKWWPVSLCPKLTTLRQVASWEDKVSGWLSMLKMCWEVAQQHQIGLDVNPSNFGWDDQGQLYYIDDEVYPSQGIKDMAEAIATRIPEESRWPEESWRSFGEQLQTTFFPLWKHAHQWREVKACIEDYPITSMLAPRRSALILGLSKNNEHLDPSVRRRRRKEQKALPWKRTLVFSDIHGNYPALEAVLGKAKDMEVDSYLFLGDVVGYGPFPKECVDRVAALPSCICLKGNHDEIASSGTIPEGTNRLARESLRWTQEQLSQEQMAWLGGLSHEHSEPPWLAVHGAPQDPDRIYAYVYEMTYRSNLEHLHKRGYSLCFYGHTHVPFVYLLNAEGGTEKLSPETFSVFQTGQVALVNPGSVGQPRDRDPMSSFAIWEHSVNQVSFHRVAYDVESTMNEIIRCGLPDDLCSRLEMGW